MPDALTARARWAALVVVCFAQFMVVLDATIVNVALPSIQTDLHLSTEQLQWIVNAYTLMFGGFLLLGGRAADLIGRRRLFLIGIALFSAASAANALANTGEVLIIARGVQGLGAALVSPAALSIITTTFAEGKDRTRAMGVWGAIAGAGGAFGLLLGGILTDVLSWPWIFVINVPIGIGTAIAALRYVPESRGVMTHRRFDLAGAVTVTAGLIVLVYAIVTTQEKGWGSLHTLGLSAVAVALLAAFVAIEHRSVAPLVRLGIFRVRTLATANVILFIVVGGLFGMFFFATLYVQQILGYSPLEAGFAFLPVTFGIIAGAGLSQQLIQRIGVKPTVLTGLTLRRGGPRRAGGDDQGRRLLPGHPLRPRADVDRDGQHVRAADAGGDDGHRGRGRRPRLRPVQHLPAGGRRAGARGPLVAGRLPYVLVPQRPGRRALPHEQQVALVEGFQLAFTVSAGLMIVGVVMAAVLLRTRDLARIDATQPVMVGA